MSVYAVRFINSLGDVLKTEARDMDVLPDTLAVSVNDVAMSGFEYVGVDAGVVTYQNKRDPLLIGRLRIA